jgi:hypothetical protein
LQLHLYIKGLADNVILKMWLSVHVIGPGRYSHCCE